MRIERQIATNTAPAGPWSLVVPLKPLARAKSRLAPATGAALRPRLALAFARDTVAAALSCPAVRDVVVVTDDTEAGAALAALGARIVPDEPDRGLNAALAHGERTVRAERPGRLSPPSMRICPRCARRIGPGTQFFRRISPRICHRFGWNRYNISVGCAGSGIATGFRRFFPGPTSGLRSGGNQPDRHRFGPPGRGHRRRSAGGPDPGRRPAHGGALGRRSAPRGPIGCRSCRRPRTRTTPRRAPAVCSSTTAPRWNSTPGPSTCGGLRLLRPGQRVRIEVTGEGADLRITLVTLQTF